MRVKHLKKCPEGWHTAAELARLTGLSEPAIRQAKSRGTISDRFYCTTDNPKNANKPIMVFDKIKVANLMLSNKPRDTWPEWFLEYKGPEKKAPVNEEGEKGIFIGDIHEAKLETEKLKVEKAKLELQIAKNEVISVDEVKALLLNITQKVHQSLKSFIPRTAPLVADESDVHKVSMILEEEINSSLQNLSELETYRKSL